MALKFLCIHGHFYQPPRENPWLEEIEVQDSAAPFHDWNERVAAECYGPNAAARLLTPERRITDIVNNYAHLSFNFGPTLHAWLELHANDIHRRIQEADRLSVATRSGHGNALAQAYNHLILPLANRRDRRTQILWGLADFEHHFGRKPEGLWLPEAAVDTETLELLAEAGLRFTLLSPYQAQRIRLRGGDWQDATGGRFDPTLPYQVRLPSGRSIAVFFYDGPIAKSLAFEGALDNADALLGRLRGGFDDARSHEQLLGIAVDGETFGHHKKGGDEVLALALERLRADPEIRLTNFAQFLAEHPAVDEVEIAEGTSWSCAHGLERWRSDCGCQSGDQPGWKQAWRAPLRAALDLLRDDLALLFEREGEAIFKDPWAARDGYIAILLDRTELAREAFFETHAKRQIKEHERVQALRLLELQRHAQLMYTSCGWFFSEISGLETVQNLKYAARALQLAAELGGAALEAPFLEALARAPSNLPEFANGARIYERLVRPSIVTLAGVVAHRALARATSSDRAEAGHEERGLHCYRTEIVAERREAAGPSSLTLGRMRLTSELTQEALAVTYAVLHFGGNDFRCSVRPFTDALAWQQLERELFEKFASFSLTEVSRSLDRSFAGQDFTLRSLYLDQRREIAGRLLHETLARYRDDYRKIYEDNRKLIGFLLELNSPVPGALKAAAQVALSADVSDLFTRLRRGRIEITDARTQILRLAGEAKGVGVALDIEPLRGAFQSLLRERVDIFCAGEGQLAGREAIDLLDLSLALELHPNLWLEQNELWDLVKRAAPERFNSESLLRLGERLYFDGAALRERFAPPTVEDEAEPAGAAT